MGDFLCKFSTHFCPTGAHGRGKMVKLEPFSVDSHCFQKNLEFFDSLLGVRISFQEMALTLKSACDKNPVNPSFKSPEDIRLIEFTGAR